MNEQEARASIARIGRVLHDAGLAPGTSGNLSVRTPNGALVTPTDSRLGSLTAEDISLVSPEGELLSGPIPSKEWSFHLSMYRARPDAQAVVHLHSTYSVAVSCLPDTDPADVIPPLTAYFVMRLGRVRLVPFFPPGSPELAAAVEQAAAGTHSLLLANHGSITSGSSLDSAAAAAEELEQSSRLLLLLRGENPRLVSDRFIAELSDWKGR